jgi:hypothetical protein
MILDISTLSWLHKLIWFSCFFAVDGIVSYLFTAFRIV